MAGVWRGSALRRGALAAACGPWRAGVVTLPGWAGGWRPGGGGGMLPVACVTTTSPPPPHPGSTVAHNEADGEEEVDDPVARARAAVAAKEDVHTASSRVKTRVPERKRMLDSMLRVDHAGEVGAVQIYEGQLWALGKASPVYETIARMKEGEEEHVRTMERLMAERRARPTLLLPLWQAAGFALGAATAVLGKEAAMACTVAVETVIGEHYNDQIRSLLKAGYPEHEVLGVMAKHRDEELEHLHTGLAHEAEKAPLYTALSAVIKTGCKVAVEVAKRV